ncbi:hypothetical protein GmHk_08G023172 [Glycine max]|nr:hypothetical protein GmHk_08G023172 [Glycine max]
MVAEALSGMMSQAIEKGLFKGFLYGKNKLEISLLQYADDTIFFGEASMENVRAIKAMLRAFELVSDLKINLSKSGFGAFGVSDGWKNVAAEYLNCSLLTLPFTYFGRGESTWWRDLKLMFNHPQYELIMNSTTSWRVGMGTSLNFGRIDGWVERTRYLQDTLGCIQNQSIQHMGAFKDVGWEWDFRWRRPLFDNEIEMTVSFLSEVARHPIQPHIGDQWEWKA